MSEPYKSPLYQINRRLTLEAAGYRCQMTVGCNRHAVTVDHVVPLALGGSHAIENLGAACRVCNSVGGAGVTNRIKAAKRQGRASWRW